MKTLPIGIFDSGIGGITVFKELKKKMPNENYIYLGDMKNFPYGEKSKEEIIEFTRNNIKELIKRGAKIIIIACGTATSQALDIVKNEFDIPIIGIIEPTAKYVSTLSLNKIGVIATSGTIRSRAWEKQIKEKDPNIEVINKACPLLANIVEEGKATTKESLNAIHEYMENFKKNKVDTIILGCTHYPVFTKIIQNEFEYPVKLINTGVQVAEEVYNILKEKNMLNDNINFKKEDIIFSTKQNDTKFLEKVKKIIVENS